MRAPSLARPDSTLLHIQLIHPRKAVIAIEHCRRTCINNPGHNATKAVDHWTPLSYLVVSTLATVGVAHDHVPAPVAVAVWVIARGEHVSHCRHRP